jgi:hypothetical protein
VGFVVDKVAMGQVFSEYFSFPCQFSFHRLLHSHHHLSSGAGTIGQLVADIPSGLSLTPTPRNKKKKLYLHVSVVLLIKGMSFFIQAPSFQKWLIDLQEICAHPL